MNGFTPEDLQRVIDIKNATTDVKSNVRDINKELKLQGELTVDINAEFSNINSSTSKFVALQKEAQQSSSATAKAIKEQTKQQNVVKTLNIQIDELYRRSRKTNDSNAKILVAQASALSSARDNAQSLANSYSELAESSASIDGSTMWFSSFSEFVKDIPGLRKLSGPFDAAAKASRQTVLSNAKSLDIQGRIGKLGKDSLKTGKGLTAQKLKQMDLTDITQGKTGTAAAQLLRDAKATSKTQSVGVAGLRAGFKSLGPILSKAFGPLALIKMAADAVKFLFNAAVGASKATAEMSRNMLISRESARELYSTTIPGVVSQFNTLQKSAGNVSITIGAYEEALANINNLLGFQLNLSKDFGKQTAMNVGEVAKMSVNFGLSAEASKQLFLDATRTNVPLEDMNKSIFGTLGLMSVQSGLQIDINKAIEEAAKVSGNMRANFSGSTEAIAAAVFQSKLLGLSLSQLEGTASSLLDFQSSIENEMAAELLTGKQLNLEKAREASLMGDMDTLMKEISEQAGTQEEFLSMNIVQRQALAKAVGMEVNELADMYKMQSENDALAQKNLEIQNKLRKDGKSLLAEGFDIQQASLAEIRIAAEKAGKSEAELRDLLGEQIYLRKQEEDATQKFNKALQQAKDTFARFVDGGSLDKLANVIADLADSWLFDSTNNKLTEEQQQQKVSKQSTGDLAKDAEFAKQLKIANLTQGAFGVATSFTSEGLATNSDIKEAREFIKNQNKINQDLGLTSKTTSGDTASDFISRPGQPIQKFRKDDLIVGGTSLGSGGGEVATLLKELIVAVKNGGDVYMDGAKVGKSLVLSSSRMG